MPESYTIKDGDWLSKVARVEHNKDTALTDDVDAILDESVNPGLRTILADNPNVLPVGMVIQIPDFKPKTEVAHMGQVNRFQLNYKKNHLRVALQWPQWAIRDVHGWGSNGPQGRRPDVFVTYRFSMLGKAPITRSLKFGGGDSILVLTGEGDPDKSPPLGQDIPDGFDAELTTVFSFDEIPESSIDQVFKDYGQSTTLHIGGLAPLVSVKRPNDLQERKKAVQKILANMGLYEMSVDGNFGKDTRESIMQFQQFDNDDLTGFADESTSERLWALVSNRMATPTAIEGPPTNVSERDRKRCQILFDQSKVNDAAVNSKDVSRSDYFFEPTETAHPPTNSKICGDEDPGFRLAPIKLPSDAYVAPSWEPTGQFSMNPNALGLIVDKPEFIYLDVGSWMNNSKSGDYDQHYDPNYSRGYLPRDFGLIWGSHVYLCVYLPGARGKDEKSSPPRPPDYFPAEDGDYLREGLDSDFFKAVQRGQRGKVRVLWQANMTWAPSTDFDWTKLYLVLGDLHTMAGYVATIWKDSGYLLDAEVDFFDFARTIASASELRGKLVTVQTGDLYDLWVSYGLGVSEPPPPSPDLGMPLFEANEDLEVKLAKARYREILGIWVHEIEGTREHDPQPVQPAGGALERNWVSRVLHKRTGDNRNWTTDLAPSCLPTGADEDSYQWYYDKTTEVLINPVVGGLRMLQSTPGIEMVYVYGNHDNYLALGPPPGTDLRPRELCYEEWPLIMEHGHRLEYPNDNGNPVMNAVESSWGGVKPLLSLLLIQETGMPTNYDGSASGFRVTNAAYQAIKANSPNVERLIYGTGVDVWFTNRFQREDWITEYARTWMGRAFSTLMMKNGWEPGRLYPPHFFIMGHTHIRRIFYVPIGQT